MQLTVVVGLGRDLCFLPTTRSQLHLEWCQLCTAERLSWSRHVAGYTIFNLHIRGSEKLVFPFHHGETETQTTQPAEICVCP